MVGNPIRKEIPDISSVTNVILSVLDSWFPAQTKSYRAQAAARIANQLFPEPDPDDLHKWTIYIP